nr:thiamine pyrophosphate-dependent enzyme [Mesobacterium pallidum]
MAKALRDGGAHPLFGVVGDANAYMVDAYARQMGGRYVAMANESGAVLAALGAAQLSGGTGFATVTHGPALTNCVTALVEAVKSNTPLVLLCGDTPATDRENLQNVDQHAVIRSTGTGLEQMRSPATAVADLARAVRRARAERRPIAFNMPAEMQWEEADGTPVSWDVPPLVSPRIEGAGLDDAIGIIAAARAPVVLAGRGAVDGASRDALTRLAQRIEAPLATTMRARHLFAGEDHVLGVHGTVSAPGASDALMRADCLIAFGASLNFHTTAQGSFLKGKRVIQVMDRAQDIGANAVPDVGILGNPSDVAETFLYWLDEAEIPASGFTRDLAPHGLDTPDMGQPKPVRDGCVDFLTALDRLDAILPADRSLVTDAGRWMVRSYGRLTAPGPLDHVTTASFGSIGLGMAAAIGAAATRPERPTVLFCGDGGFMLGNLAELNTATREGLGIICVIFNDGSYGAEHIQFRDRQIDPAITLFDWPDFVTVARALGGDGHVVASLAELEALPAALDARRHDRPFLVDVKLDPDQVTTW